jgi:ADP-heptose:LPS heptosyltransferase
MQIPKLPRISTHIAMRWARRHAKRFPPKEFSPLPPDTTAKILVVNTTGIGDTIFCTAAIADLRESFPNATIDMFVDRRRITLVENNPRIDKLLVYPGKYKRVRHTIREIQARKHDVALIQHANEPDIVPMIAASKPGAMVGFGHDTFNFMYSVAVPQPDRGEGYHTIDGRLALTKALGAAGTHWHTELYLDDGDRAQAAELLDEFGVEHGSAIALNLGGSLPSKRWPVEHWCALARVLADKDMPCVFVGGPHEQLLAEMVREHLPESEHIHFAVGELPFNSTAALVRKCRALVSGDTGMLHAALALDVPTVAMFGPDDPSWTGPHPKQQNAIVVSVEPGQKPEGYDRRTDRTGKIMKLVSVDKVVEALHKLLA